MTQIEITDEMADHDDDGPNCCVRAGLRAAAPLIAAQTVEQAAVTACGDLARTLRHTTQLRQLADRLADAAGAACLAANAYGADLDIWERLCNAADAVHEHLAEVLRRGQDTA